MQFDFGERFQGQLQRRSIELGGSIRGRADEWLTVFPIGLDTAGGAELFGGARINLGPM